jgi:aminocarboxymuconate-semialdehyde decarboxylase
MRVEAHAHVIPHTILGTAGKYGPELVETDEGGAALRVGPYESRVSGGRGLSAERMRRVADPSVRIAEMDEIGIDKMAISTSPLFYLYWAEDDVRVPFVANLNDALAEYCATAPERLFVVPTLPLPNVEASIEEVRRAVSAGARGINIGTSDLGDGLELDSKELWPLYEEIESQGLPLFVHPHPLTMATGALDRYNLSWIVGYTYQETLAVANLTLGGVFDDFPGLRAIIPHGGGNAPYQWGRLAEAQERQPDVRSKKPIAEYLPNLYFDILLHDVEARRFLLEFAGADQLVVGSNFGGWDAANGFALLDEMKLAEEEHDKIAGTNAAELFGLSQPAGSSASATTRSA